MDIVQKSDCYETWLYKEAYSHKIFIVGLPTTVDINMETVELIAENILKFTPRQDCIHLIQRILKG